MEQFTIKNRYDLHIVGEIMIPENPIGTSFVLHGLGGFRQGNGIELLAKTLFENNYIVVNFDATNSKGESGGEYENATWSRHYEDLVDVISWAKEQNWFIPHIVLTGHSMGAYAILRYGEDYPKSIEGIFAYAPVISGELSFEANQRFEPEKFKSWKETGWFTRISISRPGIPLTLPWSHMEERLNHNLLNDVGNITFPILVVAGENDWSCPPEHQQIFIDALPENTDKELHIVKNAPHTFRTQEHLDQLKTIFDTWLKRINKK